MAAKNDADTIAAILEGTLDFYRRFRRGDDGALAYLIKGREITYDYGVPIRSLCDAHAYAMLAFAETAGGIAALATRDPPPVSAPGDMPDEVRQTLATTLGGVAWGESGSTSSRLKGAYAARMLLLVDVPALDAGGQLLAHECKRLIDAESRSEPGRFSGDLAFQSPQIVLAMAHAARTARLDDALRLKVAACATRFVSFCSGNADFEMAVGKYNGFIGNWVCQATAECALLATEYPTCFGGKTGASRFLDAARALLTTNRHCGRRSLVDICRERLAARPSICEEACSMEGLLAAALAGLFEVDPPLDQLFTDTVARWHELQVGWRFSGGFRYYPDAPWYRVDITSHVVSTLLKLNRHRRRASPPP